MIEAVEDILDEFDFNRTMKVMEALEWKWVSCEGVPSFSAQRKQARGLLVIAYNQPDGPDYMCGTGGFEVTRYMYAGDPVKYLSLKFVVTESNNYA